MQGLLQLLFGMDDTKRYLSPAPFYHAAPLRFCLAVHAIGATIVAMEHFDAEEYLSLVDQYDITHSQVVPTMFVRMLKLPEETRNKYDVSSLETVIHAAAPCPAPVKKQMIEWFGPVIHEYYAGSEGNGFVYCNSESWLAHEGTVGQPIVGVLHIVGEDGEEVPQGESGTVYFESEAEFEYHNDPEKTAASRHPKGWTTLGDVGYVDADGFLYLTDRKAYMIISGGVNIYPQEAENVLVTHPKVIDVAVFGVPNDDFGEEVKAVVQPVEMPADDEAASALASELIQFCRTELADVKCPRSIDFREELPRHPTGQALQAPAQGRVLEGSRPLDLSRDCDASISRLAGADSVCASRGNERGAGEHDAGVRTRRVARLPLPRDRRAPQRRRCADGLPRPRSVAHLRRRRHDRRDDRRRARRGARRRPRLDPVDE